jgi:hypothetical protein
MGYMQAYRNQIAKTHAAYIKIKEKDEEIKRLQSIIAKLVACGKPQGES